MNRDEAIKLMQDQFTEGNRALAETAGMPKEEIEQKISEGHAAIQHLLTLVYDAMKVNNLLK